MTAREAMSIACRELGFSEEQIRNSQQYASLRNPNDGVDKPLEFRQGVTERGLIESLKEMLLAMQKFTPQEQNKFTNALNKRRAGQQEKN